MHIDQFNDHSQYTCTCSTAVYRSCCAAVKVPVAGKVLLMSAEKHLRMETLGALVVVL